MERNYINFIRDMDIDLFNEIDPRISHVQNFLRNAADSEDQKFISDTVNDMLPENIRIFDDDSNGWYCAHYNKNDGKIYMYFSVPNIDHFNFDRSNLNDWIRTLGVRNPMEEYIYRDYGIEESSDRFVYALATATCISTGQNPLQFRVGLDHNLTDSTYDIRSAISSMLITKISNV